MYNYQSNRSERHSGAILLHDAIKIMFYNIQLVWIIPEANSVHSILTSVIHYKIIIYRTEQVKS